MLALALGLSGRVLEWSWVRLFSPFVNTYALVFLVGGAIVSAVKFRRDPTLGHRFLGNRSSVVDALLGGWQLSGILQLWSGPPISRVVNGTTNGGRRGIRVSQVSDPLSNLPADVPGGVYWFNPAAFVSPADGAYGDTGRAEFRLPGGNQWDITLSKNWYPSKATRVQFRADFINAFNHTQLDPAAIQNTCAATLANPTCAVPGNRLGQITNTRAPREIQLGLRLSWN